MAAVRHSGGRIALIVSSGRTGTQFLARYFDANYEGVVALHEPPGTRLLRLAKNAHMTGALSRRTLIALLRRQRRRFADRLVAELYVESNPVLSGFAGVLGEVFPDATVIHVVRDPREHVRSSLNHGASTGLKGLASRLVPYWVPDVQRILDLPRRPSWLGRAAGAWVIANRDLVAAATGFARYRLLRYEELFDPERSGLRQLCRFLGLPYRGEGAAVPPTERINRGRLQVMSRWPEWTPESCREVDQICSPLMQRFGYGQEAEWLEKVARGGRG